MFILPGTKLGSCTAYKSILILKNLLAVARIRALLAFLPVDNPCLDQMLDIDPGSLKPFPRVDCIPQKRQAHDSTVDKAGVVHIEVVQVLSLYSWEAKNRDDQCDVGDGNGANGLRESSKIPWSCDECQQLALLPCFNDSYQV